MVLLYGGGQSRGPRPHGEVTHVIDHVIDQLKKKQESDMVLHVRDWKKHLAHAEAETVTDQLGSTLDGVTVPGLPVRLVVPHWTLQLPQVGKVSVLDPPPQDLPGLAQGLRAVPLHSHI